MQCTNISPKFECQGQRSRSPGTKKRKTDESSPLTTHSKSCAVGRMQQDDTIAPPGVSDYAGGKISACCLVSSIVIVFCFFFLVYIALLPFMVK